MQVDERAMEETIVRRFGSRDKIDLNRLIKPLNMSNSTKSAGFLYVVRSKYWPTNLYKYGMSENDERRISGYNNHNPNDVEIHAVYICTDVKDAENHLHTILNVYRYDRTPNGKREYVVINFEYLLRLIESTLQVDIQLSHSIGVRVYSTYKHNCDNTCKEYCSSKVLDVLFRPRCDCKILKKTTVKRQVVSALFRAAPAAAPAVGSAIAGSVTSTAVEGTSTPSDMQTTLMVNDGNHTMDPARVVAGEKNHKVDSARIIATADRVFARNGSYKVMSELPYLKFVTGYRYGETQTASSASLDPLISAASASSFDPLTLAASASSFDPLISAELQKQFDAANLLVQQKQMVCTSEGIGREGKEKEKKMQDEEQRDADQMDDEVHLKPNQRRNGWLKRRRDSAAAMIDRQSKQKVTTSILS